LPEEKGVIASPLYTEPVVTELHLQALETRSRVLDLAFDVVTELVEIDPNPRLVAAARYPVVAGVVAHGKAEVAPIADVGSPARLVLGIDIAVEQLPGFLAGPGVNGTEAGDVIVGGAALQAVEVQRQVSRGSPAGWRPGRSRWR